MRKHRYPGGVKVARFPGISEVSSSIPGMSEVSGSIPGMSEVTGSIPVSGLFSIDLCCIYLVFTM